MTPGLDEGRKDLLPSRVPHGRVRLPPKDRRQKSEVRDQKSRFWLLTSDFRVVDRKLAKDGPLT